MEGYRFRQVICPFCKKPYMTRILTDYSITVKHNGEVLNGWSDHCPKCNGWFFMIDNVLEGVDLSKYPEDEIEKRFFLA